METININTTREIHIHADGETRHLRDKIFQLERELEKKTEALRIKTESLKEKEELLSFAYKQALQVMHLCSYLESDTKASTGPLRGAIEKFLKQTRKDTQLVIDKLQGDEIPF